MLMKLTGHYCYRQSLHFSYRGRLQAAQEVGFVQRLLVLHGQRDVDPGLVAWTARL
jgi:hypothetical protein